MFKLLRIPHQVSELIGELEMFFTLSQWVHLQTMLVSLLITPFKATVRGRMRVLEFGTHRTKHNEFLQKADTLLQKALGFYAMKLIALLHESASKSEALYIILDDTKTAKRGKHVQAAFLLYDHTTKHFLWGQQFVCVTLQYRGMLIPYAIELYRCKADCQQRHLPFRKVTQIAQDLLTSLPDFGVKQVYVLTDTYYASKNIIQTVRSQGIHFISFFKSNRRITINGRSTIMRRYMKSHFAKERKQSLTVGSTSYRTVRRMCTVPRIGDVVVIFSQIKGHHMIMPLFSTDTTLTAQEVISMYRKRWSIEVLFKLSKQYLGLTAYHHRDEHAARTHLQLVLLAHALLTHLFMKEQRAQGKTLTNKLLATFSLRDTQQHFRALVAADTLDCVKDHVPKRWLPTSHYKDQVIDQVKTYLLAA